jgi:AraC-like DNA-binding protein
MTKDAVLEHLYLSTADVPERQQYAFWRDGFNASVLGIRNEPLGPTDRGFRAEAEAWISPSLQYFRYSSENAAVSRSPREVGRRSWGSVWIYRERSLGAQFEQGGRQYVTAPGGLIIADSDQTHFATRAQQSYCHDIWMLPKSLIGPHLPALGRPLWVPQEEGAGLSALLVAYLDTLGQEMCGLAPSQLEAVAGNLARLVATACGAPHGENGHAIKAALLERAKAHIARHLADPALGPATAAAALGVSERTLHLAFAPSDVTFAEEVMRQRLAECRATLSNPMAADRSIVDIAFGWGFASLATFYRAFQRQFGMPPGELREAALRHG